MKSLDLIKYFSSLSASNTTSTEKTKDVKRDVREERHSFSVESGR